MNIEQTKYPTTPDSEGFYIENSQDEYMGITTKKYDNASIVKKVILKNDRVAIVRELDRKEMNKVREIAGDSSQDPDRMVAALIALSTKIDGNELIMEDVLEYKAKDFGRLSYATQSINF